ncbi:alpha/beta fold hydrolase [Microlunatus parietis]|uniref:Pimeloyl-ACP methyl ester carboxylesterase n=1 Tax=Microlunatus parietis TaxID=682979 RepID=A0A7Y9I873_9ACTN|nr:alpha/beta hydrolase [Microlunatus parietis]NYE72050.1 pimeloyl-ACP methyl ester carboxylesterase [Microlunatus parietis]
MPYVEVEGIRVHHVITGPDDPAAPTLVLVHGFTVDHRVLSGPFEPVFADHPQWRRIYLDLPGHGRTAAPEVASSDDVFQVLRAAVEALAPGRYALVGQSYGGYLARGLAAVHADRLDGLAIIVPVILPRHEERDLPPRQVLIRDPEFAARLGAELDAEDLLVVQAEETWRALRTYVQPGLDLADPDVTARIATAYQGSFPVDVADFIRPCLIMVGRQDHITGYRDAWTLLERYPRATFAVLDQAGHGLDAEQPVLARALFGEWLDRVTAATTALG